MHRLQMIDKSATRRNAVAGMLRRGVAKVAKGRFDYIVVGAGSAGCVLANRLTADGRSRVLLLEAGGSDRRFWIRTPIGYGKSFYDRRVNWMYQAGPCPGIADRTSYWPRGKVFGGSSSINAMVYIRGFRSDFDRWRALGNPGWGWHDVLPYFKRAEDNALGADELHGTGGPLHVSDIARDAHPLCQVYLAACSERRLPVRRDLNGADTECVGLYQVTVRKGIRESSATAYLHPALGRRNLVVKSGAHAARILFEGQTAVGVEYLQDGVMQTALAAGEVILAAGAVNSPQVLQLSGIGPGEVLRRNGIDVVHDAPAVGRNLQDHLGLDHLYRARCPTLNSELYPWWGKLRAGIHYVLFRRGPLSLSVNQGGGFVRSRPSLQEPNLQLYFSPLSYVRAPPGKRPLMSPDPFPGFLLGYSVCRPSSRGYLQIKSPDPLESPEIHPNYLATADDVGQMLEGARFLRWLAGTKAMSSIIDEELTPGASVVTEEALIEDIRQRSTTVFHPVGTCAMGPDPNRFVVDHKLQVHGVRRLRVIDASIFPTLTSGNTNAPAIMVGEKGADLVLADVSRAGCSPSTE